MSNSSPLPSSPPAAEHDRLAMPVDREEPPRLPFPVVGIGGSAGGLEAFIEFFKAMAPDADMAFVVVQHLPPERESLVTDILANHTRMRVQQVEDGIRIAPNQVYVIRPGRTLTIREGRLHLGDAVEKAGHRRPVDDFFRSLAEEQRERAICITMSGMGSNGTAGAQAVKAVGGICIAQDPDSAKFPSMPRSLIEAGYADFILRPAEMPELLTRYSRHPYTRGEFSSELDKAQERTRLGEILSVLRTRMRMDFTGYKKATVVRRIQRRMGLHQLATLSEYARFLRQSPVEISALADDLMIHVTGFFRDPEVWQAVQEKVIAPLFAHRPDDLPIRAWVTACSTGEEAYTLAILLAEAAEASGKHFEIKIFATDTAERSLAHARAGIYPGGIESEISAERLERFFDRDDANYRVKKELRELVVFAPQNILQDPPFSRLDFCTCRNLLIYLEAEVQKRALTLIHFGLREGGALLLGTSETITGGEQLYETVDKKHRIFRRVGPARYGPADFPRVLSSAVEGEARGTIIGRSNFAQLAQQALLLRYGPPAVIVDRQGYIVFFHGDTDKFLDQPKGEPTRDLITLSRDSVRGAVRMALQKALAENGPALVRAGTVETAAGQARVEVSITPLNAHPSPLSYFLVSFSERLDPLIPPAAESTQAEATNSLLQVELNRVRDELQSTIEELQTSNEEMKASNEETTSVNEELQSVNEELETSKEELQSLNEELTTVNAQLQTKMEELEATTNDLSSLLTSTNIAVIFLDATFCIRRFTPAVKDLIDLIPADVGRPLNDLARKFADETLIEDAQRVLDTLVPREAEVRSDSGRVYVRRAQPYRTRENRIEGVVVTFVDITERKEVEDELRLNERRHRVILEGVKEYAIFMIDIHGRIETWTPAAERVLGFSAAEALGQSFAIICTPEDREAKVPEREFELAARNGSVSEDHWHIRRDGRRFWGTGMLYALKDNGREISGYVKVLRDNTDHKAAEEAMLETRRNAELANEAKDHFLANVSHELRTPLSAMLLWTKLLSEGEALKPALLREGLDAIQKCAEEQQALIEDLVDTSRIAAGKLRLERVVTDLLPTIRSAVEALRPAAFHNGLSLEEHYDPKIGKVRADPHRLHQVVWNLLTNAAKFTPVGGRISVSTSRNADEVVIAVSDTGQGIAADLLPRIFDRFRQGENMTTRAHRGLGLGLSITRQLVELHEGTISAESDGPGRGSTFTVVLPLPKLSADDANAAGSTPPMDGRFDLAGLKILLVEDAPDTRKALIAVLADARAEVTATDSVPAAFEAFKEAQPEVLLSDIGLPGQDGYELLRKIRRWEADQGWSETPALALTAYADDRSRRRALENGFRKCLTKPVNPALLLSSLGKIRAGSNVAKE